MNQDAKQLDYFERKLDSKNRLTIPTQLRDELGKTVVITPGFGKYLHMYSSEVWNTEMEPALTGDILDESKADLNVRFRMGKSTHGLDSKQGRVTLEAHQMALLGSANVIAVRAGKYWRISAKS
jgi:DNA-binding transcriptional regulator/RsmH inhibitor MraZ